MNIGFMNRVYRFGGQAIVIEIKLPEIDNDTKNRSTYDIESMGLSVIDNQNGTCASVSMDKEAAHRLFKEMKKLIGEIEDEKKDEKAEVKKKLRQKQKK